MKKTLIISATIILATGCGLNLGKNGYSIESLTGSESRIISAEIAYTKTIQPIFNDFVRAANPSKVFDSDGTTGHSAVINEFDSSIDAMENLHDHDEIYSGEKPDAICFVTRYGCDRVIVVDNETLQSGAAPYCLAHEGIHIIGMGHDSGLESWIDANSNYPYQIDFFNQIQSYQDAPYLTDVFFGMSQDLYNIFLLGKVSCETSAGNVPPNVEAYTPTSCTEWAEEKAEDMFDGFSSTREWEDVFNELGITESEVQTIIEDSELCEDLIDFCESL